MFVITVSTVITIFAIYVCPKYKQADDKCRSERAAIERTIFAPLSGRLMFAIHNLEEVNVN